MAKFADIPLFTRSSSYGVDISLPYLASCLEHYVTECKLDVSPDFQRNYVWKPEQKVRYLEYILRGGRSGRDIYFNSPYWMGLIDTSDERWNFVLVDGKQRLDAAIGFLNNEFKVFGAYYREYTDSPRHFGFRFHINDLKSYEEVLQWYLDLNTGGTVHSEDELVKVRALLEAKTKYVKPSEEERLREAHMDRAVMIEAKVERELEDQQRSENAKKRAAEEALKPKRGVRGKKK